MDLYLTEPIGPFHTAPSVFNTFTAKQNVSPTLPVIHPAKWRRGTQVHVKARGDYSSLTGAALTLGFFLGTRAGAITADLALAGAFTTGTTPAAWPWWMEWEGYLNSDPGTAAVLLGAGEVQFGSSLTAYNTASPIPLTAALRSVTFDSTIERAIGVSATWGASSASNQVTVNQLKVGILN